MVLTELGMRLTSALRKLHEARNIDETVLNEVLNEVGRALMESDVNLRLIAQLQKRVRDAVKVEEMAAGISKPRVIQTAVVEELTNMLDPGVEPYQPKKGRPNVIMFVGLQGAGKTTTIAKYARYYQRKGWKTCMICADTFRAGALDQLAQNAARLRVDFFGKYTEPDPVKIAAEGVAKFRKEGNEIIIVDTSGRHKQEAALFEEMQQVAAAVSPDEIIFVMDSTQGQAVYDQAMAFKGAVDVGSVVISKLDGNAKGGGALSAVAATSSPITFIGTGEHFEDLEPFHAKRFIKRILGMGDLEGILDVVKGLDQEKQKKTMQNVAKGKFTLRDMRDQFENLMGMGSISKIMSMIPGFSNLPIPAGGDQDGEKRLRKFLCMMDSMTESELDGAFDGGWSDSRMERVARGSGSSLQEVNALLAVHKQFEKMVGKMGKTGLLKGGDAGFSSKMSRNPKAVMQQLAGSMDKRLLQSMGGAGNIMNMMKEIGNMDMGGLQSMLGGGGGMPDLGKLAGMAGGMRGGRRR